MPNVALHLGDAVKWAREYSGEPFHAILCDAPYHLTSIVKRFGKTKEGDDTKTSERVRNRSDGFARLVGTGFMGKVWDGGDLAFNPETWEAFGNILHSGAFGMAFASSRGWHRMAVAIEDAGFIIHPSLFGWAYGSGFPKATRVKDNTVFSGHRYGLQALKPALEPIIVFQKPYSGRPIDNITETGAGVLWVDGGRIGTDDDNKRIIKVPRFNGSHYANGKEYDPRKDSETWESGGSPLGRWPANFYLDAEAARRLDEQSGTLHSQSPETRNRKRDIPAPGVLNFKRGQEVNYNDSGGASRFFFRVEEQIDEADPVRYVAKASRRERDAGCDALPLQHMGEREGRDNTINSKKDLRYENRDAAITSPTRNPHPTIKPLALTRYLATLLLPPAEYAPRRLFVPFSGVASECIGAIQAGWDEVVGVEITEEYLPIAQARVDYWKKKNA